MNLVLAQAAPLLHAEGDKQQVYAPVAGGQRRQAAFNADLCARCPTAIKS
ncbi:MAG: hypothetical protein JW934_06345 [Anaerolineae bacterium]|nr:hypothetical protein [Anaerolineae bacterium]